MVKIEFIESYIKMDDGDYQWSDNHGELIRCKDCKYCHTEAALGKGVYYCTRLIDPDYWTSTYTDDYCSRAEKR